MLHTLCTGRPTIKMSDFQRVKLIIIFQISKKICNNLIHISISVTFFRRRFGKVCFDYAVMNQEVEGGELLY